MGNALDKTQKQHIPLYRFEVEVMQHLMVQCGYAIKVDGKFGPRTQKAVRQFQTDKELSVDGVVGRQTWTKLFEASKSW